MASSQHDLCAQPYARTTQWSQVSRPRSRTHRDPSRVKGAVREAPGHGADARSLRHPSPGDRPATTSTRVSSAARRPCRYASKIAQASRSPFRPRLRAASIRRSTSVSVKYSRGRYAAFGRRSGSVRFAVVGGGPVIAEFSCDWVRLKGPVFDYCELSEQFRGAFGGLGEKLRMIVKPLIRQSA
jgi:hypothetical protein